MDLLDLVRLKNIDNSGKNYGPHSKGDTESQN